MRIRNLLPPKSESYKKTIELLADTLKTNFGTEKKIKEILEKDDVIIAEDVANKKLNKGIEKISKLTFELINWSTPQSGLSGWAARSAPT